jgi:hypothetical protein
MSRRRRPTSRTGSDVLPAGGQPEPFLGLDRVPVQAPGALEAVGQSQPGLYVFELGGAAKKPGGLSLVLGDLQPLGVKAPVGYMAPGAPISTARRYNLAASAGSEAPPSPFSAITPRLVSPAASPWSAARRNNRRASSRSLGNPRW